MDLIMQHAPFLIRKLASPTTLSGPRPRLSGTARRPSRTRQRCLPFCVTLPNLMTCSRAGVRRRRPMCAPCVIEWPGVVIVYPPEGMSLPHPRLPGMRWVMSIHPDKEIDLSPTPDRLAQSARRLSRWCERVVVVSACSRRASHSRAGRWGGG